MADFFRAAPNGSFWGAVMLQASTEIGGARSVFVDLTGVKNDLTFPSWGGQLQNPFITPAKFFAGDLFELRYDNKGEDPKLYLLKTYKVKTVEGSNVKIYRDAYKHVPNHGQILMKAPDTIGGQGKAHKVTNVVSVNDGTDDLWVLTLDGALDEMTDGDIMVEAESVSDTANMLIKTVNCVAPTDGDFVYMPTTGLSTKAAAQNHARMFYTPTMHATMYIHKMSPMPKCVLDLNKSRFNGWYEI